MATAHPDGSGLLQEENGPSHTSKPIQGPLKESSDHPLEKAQPHITSHSLPLPGDRGPVFPCSNRSKLCGWNEGDRHRITEMILMLVSV